MSTPWPSRRVTGEPWPLLTLLLPRFQFLEQVAIGGELVVVLEQEPVGRVGWIGRRACGIRPASGREWRGRIIESLSPLATDIVAIGAAWV
ncbi:hypothetical protein [Streptomyces lavendulae]|uniref:hypothetical protein n=1 Tax=Streptomyces lavendulae TaxID=1914 RepID=UPI0036EA169D